MSHLVRLQIFLGRAFMSDADGQNRIGSKMDGWAQRDSKSDTAIAIEFLFHPNGCEKDRDGAACQDMLEFERLANTEMKTLDQGGSEGSASKKVMVLPV